MNYTLHHGDCLDILRTLPDNSVDAIVTDPPYGLSFMGKKWDYDVPSEDVWRECLRVLKPGGHLLAFAGTRTQHRMAVRIEDAGFEIRDMIAWVYGSGFPKSHDVSKAIDKAAGAERQVLASREVQDIRGNKYNSATDTMQYNITAPATDAASQWQGWGTALKPALEPITVARKPLIGTVAENVLTWGTGGINVDGCRIETKDNRSKNGSVCKPDTFFKGKKRISQIIENSGRWPANLIHDGSDEVVRMFPETSSTIRSSEDRDQPGATYSFGRTGTTARGHADTGSAARFFYCAKASKRDRDEGCEGLDLTPCGTMEDDNYDIKTGSGNSRNTQRRNHHPTVKPTDLMRYLCRLVTPPGGTVLDPFTGSGSTGKAAILEDFAFIGIEREAEYLDIARARIEHAINNKPNRLL